MPRLLFAEWESGLVNCLYRFGSNRQRISRIFFFSACPGDWRLEHIHEAVLVNAGCLISPIVCILTSPMCLCPDISNVFVSRHLQCVCVLTWYGRCHRHLFLLLQLCVSKLRLFIEDADQNLKYLGLLTMSKIMQNHPRAIHQLKWVTRGIFVSVLEDDENPNH